jgi:hypothetical protein
VPTREVFSHLPSAGRYFVHGEIPGLTLQGLPPEKVKSLAGHQCITNSNLDYIILKNRTLQVRHESTLMASLPKIKTFLADVELDTKLYNLVIDDINQIVVIITADCILVQRMHMLQSIEMRYTKGVILSTPQHCSVGFKNIRERQDIEDYMFILYDRSILDCVTCSLIAGTYSSKSTSFSTPIIGAALFNVIQFLPGNCDGRHL